jgi:hypothetical protein
VLDGYELRKKFLIHILKYLANEVEDNISDVVRALDVPRKHGFNKYNIRNNVAIVAFYTDYTKLYDVIIRYFKYYVLIFLCTSLFTRNIYTCNICHTRQKIWIIYYL